MAVAELGRAEGGTFLDVLDEAAVGDALVRLEVHDASRLEWSISIPLPEGRPLAYAIDVELEIPSNAFAPHAPWDQLQSFTRLDGPQASTRDSSDPVTIDGLRRHALAVASKLARASDAFSRHCLLAGSLFAVAPRRDSSGRADPLAGSGARHGGRSAGGDRERARRRGRRYRARA